MLRHAHFPGFSEQCYLALLSLLEQPSSSKLRWSTAPTSSTFCGVNFLPALREDVLDLYWNTQFKYTVANVVSTQDTYKKN